MYRLLMGVLIHIFFILATGVVAAQEPIPVATVEDLNNVRNNLAAHYIQTADIDFANGGLEPIGSEAAPFTGTYDGAGFRISNLRIWQYQKPAGLFGVCGQGSVLTRVSLLNSYSYGSVVTGALAGRAVGATISQCCVTGIVESAASIAGDGLEGIAGGLVGRASNCTISECYSGVAVSDRSAAEYLPPYYSPKDCGGLIASIEGGTISDCYSRGAVLGSGAFVGSAGGDATARCYASGPLSPYYPNCGFACDGDATGTLTASYWEARTNPTTVASHSGAARDADQMTYPYAVDTYVGWDFDAVWARDASGINNGYPYLRWQTQRVTLRYAAGTGGSVVGELDQTRIPGANGTKVTAVATGLYRFVQWSDGVLDNPRTDLNVSRDIAVTAEFLECIPVATLEDLNNVRNNLSGHYIQTADIDARPTAAFNGGLGWTPIGDNHGEFTGSYDGGGHRIRGLTIRRPPGLTRSPSGGLFGYVGPSATFTRVGLTDVDIDSDAAYLGALVGSVGESDIGGRGGRITQCFVTGRVRGQGYVGGLIGSTYENSVSQCYSAATVIGGYVGGLIGVASGGTIADCHTRSSLGGPWTRHTGYASEAAEQTGGIAAHSGGAHTYQCYAASTLDGESEAGIFDIFASTSVTNGCYWDVDLSGPLTPVQLGEPRTTDDMTHPASANTYLVWDFDNVWEHDTAGVNNGYPFLRWQTARHTLHYAAGPGGTVAGETSQVRIPGANGNPVTAIPGPNSAFLRWSDGSTQNPRRDLSVVGNIDVTAQFACADCWIMF